MEQVTYRLMTPTDGDAIRELCKASPDSGRFSYYPDFHANPCGGLSSQYPDHAGVVAEIAGHQGLIGVGDSIFGRCRFNGLVRDFAFLKAYHVHNEFRRYKVGTGIDRFLVENAHRRKGKDLLMLGAVQTNNIAQLTMIYRSSGWTPRVSFRSAVYPPLRKSPSAPAGITAEDAEKKDLEQIAAGLNGFYADYNLYEPQSADSLQAWLSNPLLGTPFCHYLVARDRTGSIIAGMGLVEEYRVRTFVTIDVPFSTKVLNLALRFIPKSGVIRQMVCNRMWFAPGRADALAFLFSMARWQWREKVDAFICSMDPRGPLAAVLGLSRWRPQITYYTMTVEEMDDRLICPII